MTYNHQNSSNGQAYHVQKQLIN